jgi:methionyl-tRNA formyltransferase
VRVLEGRLACLGADALLEALAMIEKGKAKFVPQDESKSDYARKITKEDGRLDWTQPAKTILNRMRALAGWPGTFSFYGGKRILVRKAEICAESGAANVQPGQILGVSKIGVRVATKAGSLLITELQLEGKKPMAAADFVKGFSLETGGFLE